MKQKEHVFIFYLQYIQCVFLIKKNPLNRGLPVLDNGFVICEKFMAAIWILVFYIHRKVQYEVFIGISIKRVGFWTRMNTYFAKAKKKGHKRVEESFSISSIDDTTMLLHFFQTPKIPGTFSDFLIQLEATTIEYTMSKVEWYSRPPHAAPCAPRLSAASPRPCCCNAARARRYIRKQLMKIPSRIQIAIV